MDLYSSELAARYRALNGSFKKTMVYHLGIDAGFFCEYSNMIHAMLYCLQHRIQFKLYSDDANFGWEKGWEDCFVPFCEQVHEKFHHTFNVYRVPPLRRLMQSKQGSKIGLLKWKVKGIGKNLLSIPLALFAYKKWTLLNQHVHFNPNLHFDVPELNIDGDYIQAFKTLVRITWKYNEVTLKECQQLRDGLKLPPRHSMPDAKSGVEIR